MKKSAELRQERAQKIAAQTALHTKAEAEKRSLNEPETTEFRGLQTEIATLSGKITDAEAYEANLRSISGSDSTEFNPEGEQTPAKRAFSLNTAIRSLINGTPLTGPELDAHEAAKRAAQEAGVGLSPGGLAVPLFSQRSMETRAEGQTVTGDGGAYGATTVATELQGPIDYLRPQPILEKMGAVFLTGLQGNIAFPKNKGGITAAWKGEVATADSTKDDWDEIEMTPKRLTVRVAISLQNLMQSSFDMEAYTMKVIRDEIANAIDRAGINGSGIGEPKGILNYSGINTLAMGVNGAAPTWPTLVNLETPVFVANANSAKMSYLSNPKVKGTLKTTPKQSGQPIYLMADNGDVNGYSFEVSNHVPSTLTKGTSSGVCSAAIFGDFSQMIIGQWKFLDITVDNISRKKDGYVEIIANAFIDVAVKQETAFAAVKDLLTA
jgi:HK97 family phage major capsid protein